MLLIPPTNCLLLTAKQEPYKKASLLTKNIEEFSGKSLEERASRQKMKDRKGNRTRQKNKRRDSKVESNDSPEIPDRGETSDIPGLPSGVGGGGYKDTHTQIYAGSPITLQWPKPAKGSGTGSRLVPGPTTHHLRRT